MDSDTLLLAAIALGDQCEHLATVNAQLHCDGEHLVILGRLAHLWDTDVPTALSRAIQTLADDNSLGALLYQLVERLEGEAVGEEPAVK